MVELFVKGGGFMWPILAIFVVGFIFVGERLVHLLSTQRCDLGFAKNVSDTLAENGALEAQTLCESGKGPVPNCPPDKKVKNFGIGASSNQEIIATALDYSSKY